MVMTGINISSEVENNLSSLERDVEAKLNAIRNTIDVKDELELRLKLFDIQSRNYMYGLILERLDKIGSKIS